MSITLNEFMTVAEHATTGARRAGTSDEAQVHARVKSGSRRTRDIYQAAIRTGLTALAKLAVQAASDGAQSRPRLAQLAARVDGSGNMPATAEDERKLEENVRGARRTTGSVILGASRVAKTAIRSELVPPRTHRSTGQSLLADRTGGSVVDHVVPAGTLRERGVGSIVRRRARPPPSGASARRWHHQLPTYPTTLMPRGTRCPARCLPGLVPPARDRGPEHRHSRAYGEAEQN